MQRIYLRGIGYHLGELRPISELAEVGREEGLFETLTALGLNEYSQSGEDIFAMAESSLRKTLAISGIDPRMVDAVLFATESFGEASGRPGFLARASSVLENLGLSNAMCSGISLSECANVHAALRTGINMLRSEPVRNVLVVTSDRVQPGHERLMPANVSLFSDAAASCLLTVEPERAQVEVETVKMHLDAAVARLNPSDRMVEYLQAVGAGIRKVCATALDAVDLKPENVKRVFTNNYNLSVIRSFAAQTGIRPQLCFTANLPRLAHTFSSDTLINLADYLAAGSGAPRESLLMLASGPNVWSVCIVRTI